MIRFNSDYLEGCHPAILDLLSATNLDQTTGYGEDVYCQQAARVILEKCALPQGKVHFLAGGTQANLTVIASLLQPFEGVLCPDTGHIHTHETGAVEATGHKVLPLPGKDGKITAGQVEKAFLAHGGDEHTVRPGMVYISYPTELGALYTKQELSALLDVCVRYGLKLFIDGARLGYGLAAPACGLTLSQLAGLCHVFTIGGTKVGALFGEAVVFASGDLCPGFRYHMKQRGGMLAKGRLLGLQFSALMEKDLYLTIARGAVEKALAIKDALAAKGFPFLVDSPTNQQFPIFPNAALEKLSAQFAFAPWRAMDESHTCVRLCTSWATQQNQVDALLQAIGQLSVPTETGPA